MWDLSSLTRDWTQAQQWDHWVPTTGQPGNSSDTIRFWWIHFIITIPGDGEWRFREQGRCYCPYLQRKRLSSKEVTCHLSGSQLVGNKGRIRTQVLGHQLRASLETFHSAVVCRHAKVTCQNLNLLPASLLPLISRLPCSKPHAFKFVFFSFF